MPPDTPPESHATWDPNVDPSQVDTWIRPDLSASPPEPASAGPEPSERYAETGVLGRGGIAEVRGGLDGRLGREVAIKRLQRVNSKVGRRRFLREARITAQLEHPGIVPIYDAGVDADGIPYYTMQYLRGTALSVALHEAPGLQGRMELLPAFAAVCQAMAYAHDRRVIHRDLKPDNIMLGEFGEALVVDWGLARALDDPEEDDPTSDGEPEEPARRVSVDATALTMAGQIAGTPAYMAPEQARGEPTSPATDVFALGCILYQLLTGSPPHGVADDIHEQLARARSGRIVPVRKRSPYAPPDLAAIAERCLSHDPADRYPTAAELAQEIERWSTGRLVESYRYSPSEQVGRLLLRYWVPLGLAAMGLGSVLVVGAVGLVRTQAEAARAQASEREANMSAETARRDLSRMVSDRATTALHDRDGPASRALAAYALSLRETPSTRGQLAAAWTQPGLQSLWAFRAPHGCDALHLRGEALYCGGAGAVSRLDTSGQVVWTTAIPQRTITEVALDEDRLWVGTLEGIYLLDAADGRLVDHGPGGFVVAMLPSGDGAVRSSQWGSEVRNVVDWRPPGVPIATRDGGSSTMDLHRRNGDELRLHAAGYVSRVGHDEKVGETGHVAYSMAPVSDGWLIGGDHTTWLHADGTTTPIDAIPGSFGWVQANAQDQVVGLTANHEIVALDLPSQQLITILPADGDPVRPGLSLDGTVMASSHTELLRGWRLPPLTATSIDWKTVEESPDGKQRLYCGHEGQAELHHLERGEVTPLRYDSRPNTKVTACMFLDGRPLATWSGDTVAWDDKGEPVVLDMPIRNVTEVYRVGGELVVEGEASVMAGGERIGMAIVGVEPDGTVAVQDVEASVVRWVRPGSDGWEVVHEQPMETATVKALATLPGHRVAEAPRLALDEPSRIVGPDGTTQAPAHPTTLTAARALDGRWLVTGDQGGTLRLWDLETQTLHAEIPGHDARVVDIYLTGEGDDLRIVSESFGQSIHTWSVAMLRLPADEALDAVRARDGVEFRDGDIQHVDPGL